MTGKGEKRFRFLKALLICLVLATAINGIPNLIQGPYWNPEYWPDAPSHLSDIATGIGTSAISYWLIYLMFVGVAAAVRKIKGTDIGASDEASDEANSESEAASEGKTWKEWVLEDDEEGEVSKDGARGSLSNEGVMNLKKLNGWQRLWVVVSVGWFLFLALVAAVAIIEGRVPRLGLLALAWFVPSVGLYFLGLGVGWVWRGFKLKGESQ